ncbi:MAG: radical SAM protein [Elusimicrobiota bacterium]
MNASQAPKRVDLKLGYSCNDRCLHCVVGDFRKVFSAESRSMDRTTAEYKGLLTSYRRQGYGHVTITGGEPSIRKDFVDILRFARAIGFRIGVQTNGRLFSRKSLMRELDFGKADIAFTVALHGPTARIHDAITRRPGSHEETVRGIKNLLRAGYLVTGKIVLSTMNFRSVKRSVERLIALGVRSGNIAFPHAQGRAWENFDAVVPRYRDVLPHVREAVELQESRSRGVFFDLEMIPLCFLAGREEYCAELDYLVWTRSLLDAHGQPSVDWGEARRSIKRKSPECGACRFDAVCEGPWMEYPARRGHSEFVPVRGGRLPPRELRRILERRARARDRAFLVAA